MLNKEIRQTLSLKVSSPTPSKRSHKAKESMWAKNAKGPYSSGPRVFSM